MNTNDTSDNVQVKTYRVSKLARVIAPIFAMLFVSGGVVLMLAPFIDGKDHNSGQIVGDIVLGGLTLLIAIFILGVVFKVKVEIYADKIKHIGFFRTVELRFDDIYGYKMFSTDYDKYILFKPKNPKSKQIQIWMSIERKIEFINWVKQKFNDIDEMAHQETMTQIKQDPCLGETEEQRLKTFKNAKIWSGITNVLAVVISIGAFVVSKQFNSIIIWILILLPLFALGLSRYYSGAFKIDADDNENRPSIFMAVFFPVFPLCSWALTDRYILNWDTVWIPAIALSIVAYLLTIFVYLGQKGRLVKTMWTIPLCALYGFSVAVTLNETLDYSRPYRYQATIIETRKSDTMADTYYFKLSPWGQRTIPQEIAVRDFVYYRLKKGDPVNIWVFKGRLGIPWYEVSRVYGLPKKSTK